LAKVLEPEAMLSENLMATVEKSPAEGAGLIKSIDKALKVLHELYFANRPLRVSELARALSMSPSVVSRIVSSLASSGLVDVDDETGRVHLGLGLLLLGTAALGRRKLDYMAIPVMARLAEQFDEYVSLSRLVRRRIVMLRGGPIEAMQHHAFLTGVVPVHATAPGKLLAAWESEEEIKGIIDTFGMDPYTPNTIVSLSRLREEFEEIRRVHFALECEEIVRGMSHVAAPVYDHEGRVVAALSMGGPVKVMTDEHTERLKSALQSAGLQVSRQLGFPAARAMP
jgi:IclR family transcriptional regulator, KDG regulon repressor